MKEFPTFPSPESIEHTNTQAKKCAELLDDPALENLYKTVSPEKRLAVSDLIKEIEAKKNLMREVLTGPDSPQE